MKKNTISIICLLFTILVNSQDIKKVLIIGIDGCRADALITAITPNIDSLIDNGVYSPDALNDDITISGPGWSANLCGVWSNKHLVTNNNFDGNNYEEFPPFFHYVEIFNEELNTVSICNWNPINDFIVDDSVDFKLNVSNDGSVSSEAVSYIINNNPDVLFLHFDDVDHAGHSYGFSPEVPEYIDAIEEVDALISPIINAIENRPEYENEDWLILLTSDHGGLGTSHGGNSIQEQNVFFIASGNTIDTELIEKEITIVPIVNCLNDELELQFDGLNDFVSIPPNSLFDFGENQDFTIECRVRTSAGGDVSIVGNKDWSSGINTGFVLSFEFSSGVQWKVNIGDGSNRVDINAGGDIVDNEWYSLAVSFDRDGDMKMYLDGIFVDQANISSIGNINTNEGLFFGADIENDFNFSGAIAEVRVWDAIINESTINSWFCNRLDDTHPNNDNLIGYWKLNEDSDDTAIDSSIHTNNGDVVGATWNIPIDEVFDYSATPRIVDIPYTALTHLCVPIDDQWSLDGKSWIPICEELVIQSENLNVEIFVYPNPSNSILNIQTTTHILLNSIEIIDFKGTIISKQNTNSVSTQINISKLSKGMYFLKMNSNRRVFYKKFIKN